ncbi:MAG: NADP oxidoreductase [Desulfobulbus sp.]|nr:NADP oxidoreductase [Desulfobulbus sp.]
MSKPRLATLWLDGCSGCHMSLLDMDERLLELAAQVVFVYSPLVDAKHFPERVDVVCIEGAVSTDEDEALLRLVRQRSKVLIAMGDCAVTGNVPAMRNPWGAETMLKAVYQESRALAPQIPVETLPRLHDQALPLHHFVPVDLFIPGCPPAADTLFAALGALLAGAADGLRLDSRFGA